MPETRGRITTLIRGDAMRRLIAALLIGAVMFPQLVAGQTLAPGTRVRYFHPSEGTQTGTVIALTPDTLEVRLKDRAEPAHLPLDQVTSLEVSRGTERHPKYAKWGLLVGAGVGALVGLAEGSTGSHSENCGSQELVCHGSFAGGAFMGGALGGIAGLIMGNIPSETWVRVPLERRRISVVTP